MGEQEVGIAYQILGLSVWYDLTSLGFWLLIAAALLLAALATNHFVRSKLTENP